MVSATYNKTPVGNLLPTTRCTNCQTVFELPIELLESTDTRVRCGECLCIFDARIGLIKGEGKGAHDPDVRSHAHVGAKTKATRADGSNTAESRVVKPAKGSNKNRLNKSARMRAAQKKAAAEQEISDEASALDVTYSDFDLFSEDADLPALAYLDETRDTPEFDFDAVKLGDEETFSDTLFSHDVTINADLPIHESGSADETGGDVDLIHFPRADVDFAVEKTPEEPLVFNYVDPPSKTDSSVVSGSDDIVIDEYKGQAALPSVESVISLDDEKKPPSGAWVWLCGVLLLLVVLAATVIYPRWQSLDQSPTFRPLKVRVCGLIGCQVDTRVDIDQLKVLRREIFEVAGRDEALTISIALKNTADFAQRYPVVEARMTNRVGRSVAQRAFKPSEYLSNWQRGDVLEAGETVDINVLVKDPGTEAQDHVLQLRKLRLNCEPSVAPDGSKRWPVDCAETP